MANPAENPTASASDSSSSDATLAQRVRSKFPGEYDDMDDYTLESKVLAKYPEYSDLPRTKPPAPEQHIGAQPTGVLPWLKNLEGDIRYGSQFTAPGKLLHFLGAQGTNVGAQSGAADTVASPVLGPVKMAQGAAELPSQPGRGALHLAGGALQTATLPGAFMGPSTAASDVVPEAAEAARAGIYKNVPFLGKLFASKGAAGENFQQVMGAAKDAAVPMTDELSGALSRYQQLVDAGGSQSLSVRKLLNRVTDPSQGPLTYKEARDFYTNISRLSADEAGRLTPVMKQQVGAVRAALNNAVQTTADASGVGDQYSGAMKEFATAANRNRIAANAAKYAGKALPWVGPVAGGAYEANKIIKGR